MKSTSSSVIRPDPLRGRQAEQPPPDVAEIRLPEPTPPAASNHRPRLTRQDCRSDPDHTDVSVLSHLSRIEPWCGPGFPHLPLEPSWWRSALRHAQSLDLV